MSKEQGAHFDFWYLDLISILPFIEGVYNIVICIAKGKIANLSACTYIRRLWNIETVILIEVVKRHFNNILIPQPNAMFMSMNPSLRISSSFTRTLENNLRNNY